MSNTEKYEIILDVICNYFDVTVTDLKQKSRLRKLCSPRQMIWYFARKHTPYPLGYLGMKFNRDHATVMHGVRTVEDLQIDKDYRRQVDKLDMQIKDVFNHYDNYCFIRELDTAAVSMGSY